MILSLAAGNAAVNAVTALLNAGTPPGLIKIWTGSAPATPETADSGTLLATLTFSTTAFANASSGTATANTITSGTAVATGTAGYARAYNAAGTCVLQFTVGTSGADLIFGTLSINSGDVVACSSLTYTQPSS